MWSLLLLCFTYIEPVVLQEENRLILQGGSGPCEGYIQVYHNKQWGWVGAEGWGRKTEDVVCRSIDCGNPIESKNIWLPPKSLIWLNELKCKGNEKDLWSCDKQGWNISQARPQTVKKIKCSNEIHISLDRFKCSGTVQYSTKGEPPRSFCGDKWGIDESRVVCKTLGCGEPIENLEHPSTHQGQSEHMKVAKCLSKETSLWQCVTKEEKCEKPASVTCAAHEIMRLKGHPSNVCSGQLEIKKEGEWTHNMNGTKSKDPNEWCRTMFCGDFVSTRNDGNVTHLTCSDQVNIALKDGDKNSRCYGSVHIQRNSSAYPVCASQASWIPKNSEVVCRELNCGTVVRTERRQGSMGVMDSVSCTGDESSLWHCKAKRDSKSFPCNSEPYVICSGSVQVQLKDGPGRCAGRVELFYEGEWRKVMIRKGLVWSEASGKTVCRQLGCGGVRSTSEKFSTAKRTKAMPRNVRCTTETDSISKCIQDESYKSSGGDNEVGLVCTDHKVFLLDSSCSGLVRIQHGDTSHWLSGSDETWNKTSADMVCRQTTCGRETNYTTVNLNSNGSIWYPDPSCSSKSNPLLDCGNSIFSNASSTVAWVKCSGNKTFTLTNKCWGNVNICVEDGCGGVCAESWTKDKSDKLCENLGCGSRVQLATNPVKDFGVMFKSVHFEKDDDMSKCSLVKNDGSCESAYVVCSGSIEPQLRSSDYCSGKVEVNYENQWHSVCRDALKDDSTQRIFCKKLGCGNAVHSFDYKRSSSDGVSDMKCGNPTPNRSLTECTSFKMDACTYGGLQCSKWKKMALVGGGACRGVVVVYSEGKKAPVSFDGWSEVNGHRLCQDLSCGHLSISRPDNSISGSEFWNTTFNCRGVENEKNIWDCEKQMPPRGEELVYIECTDEPEVKLEKGCHGHLTIDGFQVCNTSWHSTYSAIVCQELNYSNAISGNLYESPPVPKKNYVHVRCEEHHHKIGQCDRFMAPCSESLVTVYCTKNVKFTTTEKCGGELQVTFDKEFGGKVCYDKELSQKYKESFCAQLEGCGKPKNKPQETKTTSSPEDIKKWDTVLRCTNEQKDLRYCLFREPCAGKKPAEVYCNGYKPIVAPPSRTKVNILAVILGVGLFLILVIVIFVFVRVYIIRKNKRVKNVLPGFAMRNDVEFESEEFPEIPPKEADNVKSGENDARSTSSIPYDDIDEVSEVQPLTSQPLTTDDPHDSDIQDNKHEQNAKEDGVTYEVEDPQENYDDIEADTEPTETTAEVHESPKNTPECSTNAPPELVLGDDDYLVPGQHG